MTKRAAAAAPIGLALLLLAAAVSIRTAPNAVASNAPATFAQLARDAEIALRVRWYAGAGSWNRCLPARCGVQSYDWGADNLSAALYLDWLTTRDAALVPWFRELGAANPGFHLCTAACRSWSDVPMWDALAAIREYDVTGDRGVLGKAEADFASAARSELYAQGACREIDYQRPNGETGLKTLETDANRILAATLLYQRTGTPAYLDDARAHYAAVRARFLDPRLPLYTVYVLDDRTRCVPLPHRFFASVNGTMISAGLELAATTRDPAYGRDAKATARAIERELDDARGVFVDPQAENDVVAPLVIAMYRLAAQGDAEARAWIVRNAAAAIQARTADGSYGRFFDGPPPPGQVTMWETNGGFALAFAAAALAPSDIVEPDTWPTARSASVALDASSSYRFSGSGIAFTGTLGEHPGHAHVLLDGRPIADRTGIWQGLTYVAKGNALLFAWRWPASGPHVVTFVPAEENVKEGPAFLDLREAFVLP